MVNPRGSSIAPPAESAGEQAPLDSPQPAEREETYHTYESHPMPWWLALLWLGFFLFAFIYLFRALWTG